MSLETLREHYLDQPHEVSIETLALCNAACTFCPYPTLERQGTKMPDELIDRLIDEMATFEKPFYFAPFKVNEPLLDKRLIPICRKVNEKAPKAILRIFTNGSALTPDKIEELATLKNVVHLWVSLNSHRAEEYQRLMGMPFERTARRLDQLHAMNFPHQVNLSTVGWPNDAFVRYCRGRWPKFQPFIIKKDSWLGFTDAQESDVPDTPCGRWFELSITATGKVSLCCMDSSAQFSIGDVNTQTLLEVYNSPIWRERREAMVSRKTFHPCSTCTY